MKLLFYKWHSFMNRGIQRAFDRLGIEYDELFYQQTDWECDPVFEEKLDNALSKGVYDRVFSVNFAPIVSNVCERHGIAYICWIYDSPIHIRELSPMKNSVNHIYDFDRGQVQTYRDMGISIEHMPLAADVAGFSEILAGYHEVKKVAALVGQLYKTDYDDLTKPLSGYDRGYLEGIIAAQRQLYGAYIVPELITDKLLNSLNSAYEQASKGTFGVSGRELSYLLATETTGRERFLSAALISKHYPMEIYGGESDDALKNVTFMPYAGYYDKMPFIFAGAAVNLNISLKTIKTGIPLRVLDILACGGFCISNMQEEIFELLKPGEELVVYENTEDLMEKVAYYMEHDEERARIAAAGHAAARERFGFEEPLRRMLL